MNQLKQFVTLLQGQPDEIYYGEVLLRAKYTGREAHLASFSCKYKYLYTTILSMMSRTYYLENEPVNPDDLCFYMFVNPRRPELVMEKLAINLTQDRFAQKTTSIDSQLRRAYEGARFLRRFTVWDIGEEMSPEPYLQAGCLVTKTKNGHHVLVPKNIGDLKDLYLSNIPDNSGDILTPIPGTRQAGHIPYLCIV